MEHQAQGLFEQVGSVQRGVGAGQALAGDLLAVGEVLGVVPECPASALEPSRLLGIASPPGLVPDRPADLVERVGGALDHVERIRVSAPPETGPSGVWSNLALTGKEDRVERQEAHTGADRAEAAGGRPAQRSWGKLGRRRPGRWRCRRPRWGGGGASTAE